MICSLGGPLSHGSPVVMFLFFIVGFHASEISIHYDVRVKSYMNGLFDPARVVIHDQ